MSQSVSRHCSWLAFLAATGKEGAGFGLMEWKLRPAARAFGNNLLAADGEHGDLLSASCLCVPTLE